MRRSLIVSALLPLAAGDSAPTVSATNATGKEVAAKMIAPGRCAGTVTVEDMRTPTLPPDQQKVLASKIGVAVDALRDKEAIGFGPVKLGADWHECGARAESV